MFKSWLIASLLLLFSFCSSAQPGIAGQINSYNLPSRALEPLRVLASDEMMGRATARPEIHIAARYISEQFREAGLKEVPAAPDYFQSFIIKMATPGATATLQIGQHQFEFRRDWTMIGGEDVSLNAPVAYLGHAGHDQFLRNNVRGKIVVVEMGLNDTSSIAEGFDLMDSQKNWAREVGAIAVMVKLKKGDISWQDVVQYGTSEQPIIEEAGPAIPLFMYRDSVATIDQDLKDSSQRAVLSVTGSIIKMIPAKNVMGWLEGTDPQLKNDFILLSAHYDHIGVASKPKMQEGKLDSIYNGARDNAIGSAAVIDAARFFAKHPTKRSILFITYTGEEIGLVGSKYFSMHPLVPLAKIIYNLNIDNASYNDTTIVTVIGLGRTSADPLIEKGCKTFGLTALPDPAPEENLFDRSDNVSLAAMGIPAPTFSLGIRKFDAEINKRYHQLSDEVGNFNLSYAMKYINSFILSAAYIANDPVQPAWIKGDKYELAWKDLYKKK